MNSAQYGHENFCKTNFSLTIFGNLGPLIADALNLISANTFLKRAEPHLPKENYISPTNVYNLSEQ